MEVNGCKCGCPRQKKASFHWLAVHEKAKRHMGDKEGERKARLDLENSFGFLTVKLTEEERQATGEA